MALYNAHRCMPFFLPLHTQQATLLFLRLCLWSKALSPRWATVAGLAFAFHPVHVEAVANIVGRAEIIAACFLLIGLLCYMAGASCHGKAAALFWLLLAILCGSLALFSKVRLCC